MDTVIMDRRTTYRLNARDGLAARGGLGHDFRFYFWFSFSGKERHRA